MIISLFNCQKVLKAPFLVLKNIFIKMNAYQVSIHILANQLIAYLSKKVLQRSWAA